MILYVYFFLFGPVFLEEMSFESVFCLCFVFSGGHFIHLHESIAQFRKKHGTLIKKVCKK